VESLIVHAFAAPGQGRSRDPGSVGLLVALIAIICVLYWRTVLRIAAVAFLAFAIYGALLLIRGVTG
jgi:hypothetical protein